MAVIQKFESVGKPIELPNDLFWPKHIPTVSTQLFKRLTELSESSQTNLTVWPNLVKVAGVVFNVWQAVPKALKENMTLYKFGQHLPKVPTASLTVWVKLPTSFEKTFRSLAAAPTNFKRTF